MTLSTQKELGVVAIWVHDKKPIVRIYTVIEGGPIAPTEFSVLPLPGEDLGSLAVRTLGLSVESRSRDLFPSEHLLLLSWNDLLAYLGASQKTIYAKVPLVWLRLFTDGSIEVHLDFFSKRGGRGDSRDIKLTHEEAEAGGSGMLDSIIHEFVADFYAHQA